MLPPQSLLGALDDGVRRMHIAQDRLYKKYSEYVDNDSAYEFMQRRQLAMDEAAAKEAAEREKAKQADMMKKETKRIIGSTGKSISGSLGREAGNALGKTVGGTFGKRLGGNIGTSLGRGLFETLFKK